MKQEEQWLSRVHGYGGQNKNKKQPECKTQKILKLLPLLLSNTDKEIRNLFSTTCTWKPTKAQSWAQHLSQHSSVSVRTLGTMLNEILISHDCLQKKTSLKCWVVTRGDFKIVRICRRRGDSKISGKALRWPELWKKPLFLQSACGTRIILLRVKLVVEEVVICSLTFFLSR